MVHVQKLTLFLPRDAMRYYSAVFADGRRPSVHRVRALYPDG